MADFYPPAPYFGDGQRISASGHLNGLSLSALYLVGHYQGGRAAWAQNQGAPARLEDGWYRVYDGFLRKKSDTLGYTFRVAKDGGSGREIRIRYNDTDLTPHLSVAAGAGTAMVSGTKSLAAHTNGQFYPIQVDIQGGTIDGDTIVIFHLAEQISASYPALYAFGSGTPTAAQWQALSTTADTIYEQMQAPRPVFPRTYLGRNAWAKATLRHRTNTLVYRIDWQRPYRDDTRQFTMFLHVYFDGNRIATVGGNDLVDGFTAAASTTVALKDGRYSVEGDVLRNEVGELILLGSKSGSTFSGCTRGYLNTVANDMGDGMMVDLRKPFIEPMEGWPWSYAGTLDLSGLGLTADASYDVAVFTESVSYLAGDEVTGKALVVGLGEQEDDIGLPSWWSQMPTWAHSDYVTGTNGVKVIRDNLAALAAKANYYNHPTRQNGAYGGWNIRRHQWLHYFCKPAGDKTMKPTLSYFSEGRQEVSLPYEPNKWLSHDLANVKGLYVGVSYELHEVTCALEDTEV